MVRSYHNKILRVNLTTREITVEEPGSLYFRRYMGGWNVVADVLLKEVPRGADPLGPENKLVFAPGVLTGLAVSGASRNAVGAKSPLTGGFGVGESGGFFPHEFKRAGYDALIVEGVSPAPVYLWIKDGAAEIRDAGALWGKTTKETLEGIQAELGDARIRAALIGPGGENMVKYACIMNEFKDAIGRTGMGAVMGSKRLKAVAVRGTMNIDGVNPDKIREMARQCAEEVRAGTRAASLHKFGTGGGDMTDGLLQGNLPVNNFRDGEWDGIGDISFIMDKIGAGMEACAACAVRCKKVVKAEGVDSDYGGPEYETLGALGSCCGVSDLVAISKGNVLCNANSLDTIGYRALGSRRWCVALGLIFGLALATKHNALMLPAVMLAHYTWISLWSQRQILRQPLRQAGVGAKLVAAGRGLWTTQPWIWPSLAVLGPLALIALWPWLWFDTIDHIRDWIRFHLTHVHYNYEYLGENWNAPPYPWHVPIVTTLLTAPAITLLAAVCGAGALMRRALDRAAGRRPGERADEPEGKHDARAPGLLMVLSAGVAMGPFVLGTTPIFGAEKHWAPAMPALCILAGIGVVAAVELALARLRAWLPAGDR
ncbi:MAG: aldehyde ferredoxin oxidoreductase N-terminal domain-containing protein, partial [Anaerolineae bacterium]